MIFIYMFIRNDIFIYNIEINIMICVYIYTFISYHICTYANMCWKVVVHQLPRCQCHPPKFFTF